MYTTTLLATFYFISSALALALNNSLPQIYNETTFSRPRPNPSKTFLLSSKRRPSRPTKRSPPNTRPTPEPTGKPRAETTVFIDDKYHFALLLPANTNTNERELISEAENDGEAYCFSGTGCKHTFPDGFITGAAIARAEDNSYIQITGCMDSTKFPFAEGDDGGQFDVRFPNGAQCTFGGRGASFIEQIEPTASRFCLRCCSSPNDQINCNSHQDRAGCPVAVPGVYEFKNGVECG